FAQHAADRKQLSQSLRTSQTQLRQLVLNGADPAAIQAKQAEVAQLLTQSVAMRVESLQAIAPILTPDQRAKLAQIWRADDHRGHWLPQQQCSYREPLMNDQPRSGRMPPRAAPARPAPIPTCRIAALRAADRTRGSHSAGRAGAARDATRPTTGCAV